MKNTSLKSIALKSLHVLCDLIMWVICASIQCVINFDRFVLKRYFQIETPVYKRWWRQHSAWMQKRLDQQHNQRVSKVA